MDDIYGSVGFHREKFKVGGWRLEAENRNLQASNL